jgi:hypothetical protein
VARAGGEYLATIVSPRLPLEPLAPAILRFPCLVVPQREGQIADAIGSVEGGRKTRALKQLTGLRRSYSALERRGCFPARQNSPTTTKPRQARCVGKAGEPNGVKGRSRNGVQAEMCNSNSPAAGLCKMMPRREEAGRRPRRRQLGSLQACTYMRPPLPTHAHISRAMYYEYPSNSRSTIEQYRQHHQPNI